MNSWQLGLVAVLITILTGWHFRILIENQSHTYIQLHSDLQKGLRPFVSSQRRGLALLLVRSLTPSSSPRLRKTHPLLGPHYGVTTSEYSETVSAVLQIWPFCKKLTIYLKQSDPDNSFKSGNAFWILCARLGRSLVIGQNNESSARPIRCLVTSEKPIVIANQS